MEPSPSPAIAHELAQFREAWKQEVRQRTQPHNSPIPAAPAPTTDQPEAPRIPLRGLSSAVDVYRLAIQYEEEGKLDDALRLYRQAFKQEPNVDKAYFRAEQQLNTLGHTAGPTSEVTTSKAHKRTSSAASDPERHRVTTRVLDKPVVSVGGTVVSQKLAEILANFPPELVFEPEDEASGIPFQDLPDELVVLILSCLEPMAIERFATVNRKARVLTLDSAIWRELVRATYIPPQVPDDDALDAVISNYMADYRRVYVEHPRLRLDGVYIAICQYIRAGLSENAWVNVTHHITYHRYLRFFPNGIVLSLLTTEEHEPQSIIPILKPSLSMKGCFIGNWQLVGTEVKITDLMDTSGKLARYAFQMTLQLRSRPLGRWNKLDFTGYDSVDIGSGEETPFPLKNERPFWFSKVRSYGIN